jgi:hypothetical protein
VPTRIPGRFRPRQVASVPELPVSREAVLVAVQTAFPEGGRRRVVKLLDTYGVDPHERERERVQLAILGLCDGSEDKLRVYLAVAKRDYRDVLLWADTAIDVSAHTHEHRRRMRELFERLGIEPPRNLSD